MNEESQTPRDSAGAAGHTRDARERILAAAYDLFSRQGIRAVGIDAVIRTSGVARMTLYRHFRSKDDLVRAFLDRRERLWARDWFQAEVEKRAAAPRDRLLAMFDILDEWYRGDDFTGCAFVKLLLESAGTSEKLHRASAECLERFRGFIEGLARDAGIADAEGFAHQWHILIKGATVAAVEGDRDAARRAREVGELLLATRDPA